MLGRERQEDGVGLVASMRGDCICTFSSTVSLRVAVCVGTTQQQVHVYVVKINRS
jgi:hypothetical protein